MVWTTLFLFCRFLAWALVDVLQLNANWRLIDLWNDLGIVGKVCLSVDSLDLSQPKWYLAAATLVGVSLTCLTYLILRIRAVEVVK
jgi:hypothetical protein